MCERINVGELYNYVCNAEMTANGQPTASVVRCEFNVQNVDVHFHGGARYFESVGFSSDLAPSFLLIKTRDIKE